MQESQLSSEKSDSNFRVAPLISAHKLTQLKVKTIGTIFGLPILNNDIEANRKQDGENYCQCNLLNILYYIALPLLVIIPPIFIRDIQLYPLACLISAGILPLVYCKCVLQAHFIMNYLYLILYGYLWSTQIYVSFSLLKQVEETGIVIATIILSIFSIIISVATIARAPVQQFSGTSINYEQFGMNSTFGMRFFVAIPTLLTSAILYAIYLAYLNSSFVDPLTFQFIYYQIIMYLNLASSILGLFGIIGWISTFDNMVMFIVNKVFNYIIFNDQNFPYIPIALLALVLNVVGAVLTGIFQYDLLSLTMISVAYWISWGSSIIIALLIRVHYKCSSANNQTDNISKSNQRFYVCLILEIIIAIALYLIFYFAIFPQNQSIDVSIRISLIIVGIDVILYVIFLVFNSFRTARSLFGWIGCFEFSVSSQSTVNCIERFVLRASSSLSILAILSVGYFRQVQQDQTSIEIAGQFFKPDILYPILVYRTFKKCLSYPRSHSLHISLLIYFLLVISGEVRNIIALQLVLFFPLFPHNPFPILATPFLIPKKLRRKKQTLLKIGYVLSTIISILFLFGTLGVGEFTMIFGMPLFWCVIPKNISEFSKGNNSGELNSNSPQFALYSKIVQNFNPQILRGKKCGYYIIRIAKYIIFVQISNQCYGLYQIVRFVGLQAQEITTCHAKEGETLDRLISGIWDENQANRKQCSLIDNFTTPVWPIQEVKKVMISAENQIKFTGIIESDDFYRLFKQTLIKSLIFYFNKILQENQEKLPDKFDQECQQAVDEIHLIMNKEKCDEIFPYQFAKQVGIQVKYPGKKLNNIGRKKLPPLINPKKEQKKQVRDDFMDLLNSPEKSSDLLKTEEKSGAKIIKQQIVDQNQEEVDNVNNVGNSRSEGNMAMILSLYACVIGKINYLNIGKVYQILNRQSEVLSQIAFQKKVELASNSVGATLKISIGKFLQESTDITLEDFQYYQKNEYLGTLQSPGFAKAVNEGRQDIWTVYYAQMKKLLTVKRIASIQTPLYILGINWHIAKAVWNNLRYQLLYATNDDDERYSIQTHQFLMRNLLVEACQEPFGYAGFYSNNIHII